MYNAVLHYCIDLLSSVLESGPDKVVDHGSDTGSVAIVTNHKWGCSGSVVECLTRDQRTAGSSHTSITALCP